MFVAAVFFAGCTGDSTFQQDTGPLPDNAIQDSGSSKKDVIFDAKPKDSSKSDIDTRGPDTVIDTDIVFDAGTGITLSFLPMKSMIQRGPVYVWIEIQGDDNDANGFSLSWSDNRGPWKAASLCSDSDSANSVRPDVKLRRFLLIWDSMKDMPKNSDMITLRADLKTGKGPLTVYSEPFKLRNALKTRTVLITFPIVEKGDAYEHSGRRLGVFSYSMSTHALTEQKVVETGESIEKPVFHPSGRLAFVPTRKNVYPVRLPINGVPVVGQPMTWDVFPADMTFSSGGRYLYFISNGLQKNGGGLYRAEILYDEGLTKPVLLKGINLSYNLDIKGGYAWITAKGEKDGTVNILGTPLWGKGAESMFVLDAGYSGKILLKGDTLLYLDEGMSKLRSFKRTNAGFTQISDMDMPSSNIFLLIPPDQVVATNWGDGRVEVFNLSNDATLTHNDTQKAGLADDMTWNFDALNPHILVSATDYSGDARIYDYLVKDGQAKDAIFMSLGKDPEYSPEYIIFQP